MLDMLLIMWLRKHKEYPLSPELDAKSQKICILTHPFWGFMVGAMIGIVIGIIIPFLLPFAVIIGAVGCIIWFRKIRNKKLAVLDEEYQKLLDTMHNTKEDEA